MTARAQQLGGMLTVTSGSGITVRLALPLPIRYSLSERE
jgi:signal transduction histidine kinase